MLFIMPALLNEQAGSYINQQEARVIWEIEQNLFLGADGLF